MLWIKAFHIIFIVTWFAGLFYLPRLFVYHALSTDQVSHERFKIMERKLYYGIMLPGGIFATLFGIWLLSYNFQGYLRAGWMQAKLAFVLLLWAYHFYLGKCYKNFKLDRNQHGHTFYRWINEIPILFLIVIVILAVVKP
jgi:putative membrane protein